MAKSAFFQAVPDSYLQRRPPQNTEHLREVIIDKLRNRQQVLNKSGTYTVFGIIQEVYMISAHYPLRNCQGGFLSPLL